MGHEDGAGFQPGSVYYVVSQEVNNGDSWYSCEYSTVTTTSAGTVTPIYNLNGVWYDKVGQDSTWVPGHVYGPLNLQYSTPSFDSSSLAADPAHSASAEWNYRYDSLGRLQKVNPDSPAAEAAADVTYEYDALGNLHAMAYRNGQRTVYTYGQRNWLRLMQTTRNSTTTAQFDYDSAAQGESWSAERRLAPTGQRRQVKELMVSGGNSLSRTVTYDYDRLRRLTAETILAGGYGPTGSIRYGAVDETVAGVRYQGQGYDLVGNRRSRVTIGAGLESAGVGGFDSVTFDNRDRFDNPSQPPGCTFDAAGNTRTDANGATYSYDAQNRLVKRSGGLATITLVYDADGNRVGKTVSGQATQYLVDDRNPTGYAQVVEERNGAGVTTVGYTYGLDLVSQNRSGTVSYYGYDGQGSVRYLTDGSTGAVTDTYTYDAFGIQIASTGTPTPNSYRYTGEQWDSDLSMYYLRARYYSPQIGRFWTMDTFQGSHTDPLSLHKYLYCHGNPVNHTDPSGRAVYVVTRPLNIKGLENRGADACHVFLFFDTDGMSNVGAWEDAVRESRDNARHPNTYGIQYASGDPDNVTFSFHPKSVLTGDEREQYFGTSLTPSSYVAFQDQIDMEAVNKSGTGYRKLLVARDNDLQMRIFNDAVRSRDRNNSGTPDPNRYEFAVFNCGSWVECMLGRHGVSFPDTTINHGVGLVGPKQSGSSAFFYVEHSIARMWRGLSSIHPHIGFDLGF